MVPAIKRDPLRQIWHPEVIAGSANAMPVWTRGDDNDDEIEQTRRTPDKSAPSPLFRSARRALFSRDETDGGNVSGEEGDGGSEGDDIDTESDGIDSESDDEDRQRQPSQGRPPPEATSSASISSSSTAPAPTSIAEPPPPPPPPPPPSSSSPPEQPTMGVQPVPRSSSTTARNAVPTAIFRPLPEPEKPSPSSSESLPETQSSTSSVGAPMTTVTVGGSQTTIVEAIVTTMTTIQQITTKTEIHLPVLPTGVRKGVDDYPDRRRPTFTSSTGFPEESIPADRIEDNRGGNGRDSDGSQEQKIAPSHAVMHALGSVGGVLVITAFITFIWWYFKKYRPKKRREDGNPPPPPPKGSNIRSVFSRNKPGQNPLDREWVGEGVPGTATTMDEKEMQIETTTYVNGYQKRAQSIGSQYFAPAQLAVAIPPAHMDPNGNEFWTTWTDKDGRPGHMPNQSISSAAAQFNDTLRVNPPYYKRTSEVSSLSSGFGDGDNFMLPSTANNTLDAAALTQLRPPPPATAANNNTQRLSVRTQSTSRDTWYTEASEDQPARFRTINSWVRQQTGRIKREKQRRDESDVPPVPALPPEEEYRMMMPDGEEPRRVDMTMDMGTAYGGTR